MGQTNMKVFIISACLAAAASAAVIAPAYGPAPVAYAPAPAYHAETYPDEISPYTYTYAVADDYSKANFNAGGFRWRQQCAGILLRCSSRWQDPARQVLLQRL